MVEKAKAQSLEDFLENAAFQKIKRLLTDSGSVNCSGYRDEYLKRRFEIRLLATGANTYARYMIYLKKHPDEFTNLLNDLTINYTTFFRDTDVYIYLERVLLPTLFKSKNPVRIWSAGCATGEEPYSLAILAHKLLGVALGNPSVAIFASDVDKDALSKAAQGEYQYRQLGPLGQPLIERYFTKEGEKFRIKDFVKRLIHFEQFDLMRPSLRQNLDLILCRNVMIYFSRESQQQIHMGFYNSLREGGYFITGKSEILTGEPAKKFLQIDFSTRVYQKPSKANPPLQFEVLPKIQSPLLQ